MTTAKPQQVPVDPDQSDDLIAELTRLMAQEVGGDKPAAAVKVPAAPENTSHASPQVRIPGMGDARPMNMRPAPEPVAGWRDRPAGQPPEASRQPMQRQEPVVEMQRPAQQADAPAEDRGQAPATQSAPAQQPVEPDPFDFDFGLTAKPQQAPEPTPTADVPPVEHDGIADLIAAELEDEPRPAPRPVLVEKPAQAPAQRSAPAISVLKPAPRPANAPGHTATVLKPATFAARPQPHQTPDNDRFGVAPVFGLGNKPGAPAPQRPKSDPMDEIENLIGEAVRVELSERGTQPVQPQSTRVIQPASRRPAARKDSDPTSEAAEAAILAAAAATGAEVGRIELPVEEQVGAAPGKTKKVKPAKQPKVKVARAERPSSGSRQYLGMAVAGTMLLASGFGLYWVLGMGSTEGPAPVLTADASSAKQLPQIVAPVASLAPGSVVLDEIEGAEPPATEQLVSRDQTEGTDVTREVTQTASTEGGLANRKVRTVTVRPDGTIVSSDSALAGAEVLPVDRPNVPTLPGGDVRASDLLTAMAEAANPTTPNALVSPASAPQATVDTAAVTASADAQALVATPAPVLDPSVPFPMPRPANRSTVAAVDTASGDQPSSTINALVEEAEPLTTATTTGGQPVDLLSTQPEPEPVEVASAPEPVVEAPVTTKAAAYVQLSSQRSESDARGALSNIQKRWGSMLQGGELEIVRADLGSKGIYYRVRVPASSMQKANELCASLKSKGADCFPVKG